MVARGEIYWAELPNPYGRRPVVVVTRGPALSYLHAVTIAPITSNIRDIPSEVRVGLNEGLSQESAITCDNLETVAVTRLGKTAVGSLDRSKTRELNRAIHYALGLA